MAFNNMLIGSGSKYNYWIDYSLALNGSNEYMYRNMSGTGNSTKGTLSTWFKRNESGVAHGIITSRSFYGGGYNVWFNMGIAIDASDRIDVWQYSQFIGTYNIRFITTPTYADTDWHHLLVAFDTDQAVATDGCKIYVDGQQVTNFDTAQLLQSIGLRYNVFNDVYNQSRRRALGINFAAGNGNSLIAYFNGNLAATIWRDGYQDEPELYGKQQGDFWVPIEFDSTIGTKGHFYDYATGSDLGNDSSTAGMDLTEVNIDSSNQSEDTPTSVN